MADTVSLRPAVEADLPALAALEAACFLDPWSRAGLALLLAPPYGGLVACVGEKLVGYIGWMAFPAQGEMPAEGEITRIAVHPHCRRQGIGRMLLAAMLDALGRPAVAYLDVRASNVAAQALYASFGFVPRGVRPRFYGDEDAIEYERTTL